MFLMEIYTKFCAIVCTYTLGNKIKRIEKNTIRDEGCRSYGDKKVVYV
jgi:hypothetical protein